MLATLHRLALRLYRRMPRRARRLIVRGISPKYTVGAICVIERPDGAVLLVRTAYRQRWGVPGGLLKRGEDPAAGARREVLEEVGLHVELLGEPAVVVDAVPQRVDIIYRARASAALPEVCIGSPEIIEARWFPADSLPELQVETTSALIALARRSARPDLRGPEPRADLGALLRQSSGRSPD